MLPYTRNVSHISLYARASQIEKYWIMGSFEDWSRNPVIERLLFVRRREEGKKEEKENKKKERRRRRRRRGGGVILMD